MATTSRPASRSRSIQPLSPQVRAPTSRSRGREQRVDRSLVGSYEAVDDVLRVNRSLRIPLDELEWRFTPSGGRAASTPTGRTPEPRSGSTSRRRRRSGRGSGPGCSSGSVRRSGWRSTTSARSCATERCAAAAGRADWRRRCASTRSGAPTAPTEAARRRRLEQKRRRSRAEATAASADSERRLRRFARSHIQSTTTSATRNATASHADLMHGGQLARPLERRRRLRVRLAGEHVQPAQRRAARARRARAAIAHRRRRVATPTATAVTDAGDEADDRGGDEPATRADEQRGAQRGVGRDRVSWKNVRHVIRSGAGSSTVQRERQRGRRMASTRHSSDRRAPTARARSRRCAAASIAAPRSRSTRRGRSASRWRSRRPVAACRGRGRRRLRSSRCCGSGRARARTAVPCVAPVRSGRSSCGLARRP